MSFYLEKSITLFDCKDILKNDSVKNSGNI